jgi:hypothetical protein
MTPKEKAEELVKKHLTAISEETLDSNNIIMYNAKQCALIAVDNELISIICLNTLCTFDNPMKVHFNSKIKELKEVKQEIELL